MSAVKIRYSLKFTKHLEIILNELSPKSTQAANSLRKDLTEKLMALKSYPKLGSKIISPIKRLNKFRKIVLRYDYLLFYYFDEPDSTLYILEILHAKQDYWHLLSD
ncbi:type II toxin-antitoxin system RelE/ParE family toxin [candidate division KSB1 bacterium]|nr:type II toxin-antitoxin system RelE/ParE family toxin [candidate division KSB1 bacterium]